MAHVDSRTKKAKDLPTSCILETFSPYGKLLKLLWTYPECFSKKLKELTISPLKSGFQTDFLGRKTNIPNQKIH